MTNIIMGKKDEIVMKIIHYFVTEENYRPIIVNGVQNEIWLENLDKDVSLIRININYIHNEEQLFVDMKKCNAIRKSIKKKTYSFKMNMLNFLLDVRPEVKLIEDKNIESIKIEKISDLKRNKLINNLFPTLKEKISSDHTGVTGIFQMTEELNEKTIKEDKKLAKIFKGSKYPTATIALIIINVLLYIITSLNYEKIIPLLANSSYFLKKGEVYRLLTCMFSHANIIHLFSNMYSLYVIGPLIEKYYGKTKYLMIYLGSGIIGALLSAALNNGFSVGASGAIFGLFGSLIYFGYKYRATLDGFLRSNIIPILLINLLISVYVPNIDLFAHLGGLVGGILFSYTLCVPNKENKLDLINGLITIVLLICFLGALIIMK